jgi:hypothetical protein
VSIAHASIALFLHLLADIPYLRPGLRDRLVFTHERYTSNGDFSRAFCACLRFFWPFGDDDILTFDPVSQTYKLSPLFEKYASDAKNWTMNEAFFVNYPEMSDDIPASQL